MFYVLECPVDLDSGAVTEFFKEQGFAFADEPQCEACQRVIGPLQWVPPFRVELEFLGRFHGDIAFGAQTLLLSERFLEQFRFDGLRGLDVLGRAEVFKVKPKSRARGMPQYHVARVRRSRAIVDGERSGLIFEKPWNCSECRLGFNLLKIERLVIEPESWHGEDLFVPRGISGVVVASQRFADWSARHGFRNVNLIPAEMFHCDYTFTVEPDSK